MSSCTCGTVVLPLSILLILICFRLTIQTPSPSDEEYDREHGRQGATARRPNQPFYGGGSGSSSKTNTPPKEAGHDSHHRQHDKVTRKGVNESLEDFIERIFKGYQYNYRPKSENHSDATLVNVSMYVTTFSSFSIIEMDYSLDMLLRQRWRDKRLQFEGYDDKLSLAYMKNSIWIPDLFFRNAKDGHLHTITNPNYLIWLYPNGTILFSQKLNVRLSCPMHLWKFPMDNQTCPVEISSFGYGEKDVRFEWASTDAKRNVELSPHTILNEFEQPIPITETCSADYADIGRFPCIKVRFELHRKFGFYLIYTYLPSILIVVISWVSFFIDFQAVPARISIGLLSVLSLITQSAATLQKLPRVSYIKAIDMWLFACLAFVVFSLLEFAIVNVLARRQQKQKFEADIRRVFREELEEFHALKSPRHGRTDRSPNGVMFQAGERMSKMAKVRLDTLKAHRVDRFCLFAYPLMFSTFNLLYWVYFQWSTDKGADSQNSV